MATTCRHTRTEIFIQSQSVRCERVLADELTKVGREGGRGDRDRQRGGGGELSKREASKGKHTPILIILLILMGRLPGISTRTKKRRFLNISVDMLHSTDPDVPAIPSMIIKNKGSIIIHSKKLLDHMEVAKISKSAQNVRIIACVSKEYCNNYYYTYMYMYIKMLEG